jgi:malate-CoA ligase subunit alpha
MVGEIGGSDEEAAAEYIARNVKKPVVGYIAGVTAPPGKRMGHAGAIISAFGESAQEKVEVLRDAGVTIVPTPATFGQTVAQVLEAQQKAA